MASSNRKKQPRGPSAPAVAPKVPSGDHVPVEPEDIGGELISLLSEGLYKNPLDAFREYIQNSIDAGAKRVNLKFTGRSVFIRDDGHGMDRQKLIHARRVGVSAKSFLKDVGFRGIGIYSAFHLCEKMLIRTKVHGTFEENVAEFDFASMRDVLGDARLGRRSPAGLMDLLFDYVVFREEHVNYEDQRTIVELHNIPDLYYGDISSSAAVEKYLLDTVPVDFDPTFEHRGAINTRLQTYLPEEQRPIRLSLAFKDEAEHLLYKKMPDGVMPPKFQEVKDASGNLQAFIWGCRNILPKKIEDPERAGFIYKLKGFTIGKVADLRDTFKGRSMLYPWWTGEVYILNAKVVPTTARDAFEYNPASYVLKEYVQVGLEPFRKDAEVFQLVTRAQKHVDRIADEYARLQARAAAGILSPSENYELISAEKEAHAQAKRLAKYEGEEAKASEVRTEALKLHQQLKQLRKVVEQHKPTDEPSGEVSPKPGQPRSLPVSDETPAPPPRPPVEPPSIGELFEGMDLDDPEEAREALEVVLACIDDVLDIDSETYRALYDAIDVRLNEDLE